MTGSRIRIRRCSRHGGCNFARSATRAANKKAPGCCPRLAWQNGEDASELVAYAAGNGLHIERRLGDEYNWVCSDTENTETSKLAGEQASEVILHAQDDIGRQPVFD